MIEDDDNSTVSRDASRVDNMETEPASDANSDSAVHTAENGIYEQVEHGSIPSVSITLMWWTSDAILLSYYRLFYVNLAYESAWFKHSLGVLLNK